MDTNIVLNVKIIPSSINEILGWAGDVLLLKLEKCEVEDIIEFLSSNIGIKPNKINFQYKRGKIYTFSLSVLKGEDLEVLLI